MIYFDPDWILLTISPSKLFTKTQWLHKMEISTSPWANLTSSRLKSPINLSEGAKMKLKSP